MIRLVATICLAVLSVDAASAAGQPSDYYFLRKADGLWCGYRDVKRFNAALGVERPGETVHARSISEKLVSFVHEIEPDSGDWILSDEYRLTKGGVTIRRTFNRAQPWVSVVQQAEMTGEKLTPWRTISLSTRSRKKGGATDLSDAGIPDVPLRPLEQQPFVSVMAAMQRDQLQDYCAAR